MKKRSTNYELLRILLTLFIPIYHWLLYNGIFYADNSKGNLISLIFFTGIPFACLYAFMAMSSFFLIKKKYSWNAKKFLIFLAQIITLLIFKNIFIRTLFHNNMYEFIDSFFIKGAWWYVWTYLVLMLIYPVLNYFIYNLSKTALYIATAFIGLIFAYNSYMNQTSFLNDFLTFLFVYMIMGCFERHEGTSSIYAKHKKLILVSIFAVFALALTGISIYLKMPTNSLPLEIENNIFQRFHARYNPFGLVGGIAVFTLFKNLDISYRPSIHKVSKITFYVYLLHETVMSVFWFFEIKGTETLAYLPLIKYFLLIGIYMLGCIITAFVVYKVYTLIIEPLWLRLIDRLCRTNFVNQLESFYNDLFTGELKSDPNIANYNPFVGLLKFVLSLLVVAIHVQPLSGNKAFYLNNCLARLAVPIFFILSSYFLFDKLLRKNWNKDIFNSQQKHLAKYYMVWVFIHIPIIIYTLLKSTNGTLDFVWRFIQGIFLKGPYGALWFLPASLLGLSLVYFIGKKTSPTICLILSLPLFLFATIEIEYNALVRDITLVNSINHILTSIFGWLANGLNVGFLFCSIGFYIASNKQKKRSLKADIVKAFVSVLLLILETRMIRNHNLGVDYWAMFFIIPTAYYVANIVLNLKTTSDKRLIAGAKYLQNMSMLIYPMHFMVMDILKRLLASSELYMSSTTLQYVIVLSVTCVISACILYFGEKKGNKIAKILYGK